jgi:hypothetical protein
MCREDDNSCIGELAANRTDRVDTAHFWHLQIHESDIRAMVPKLFERLASVRGFSNNLNVRLRVDQRGNAFAKKRVVIDG